MGLWLLGTPRFHTSLRWIIFRESASCLLSLVIWEPQDEVVPGGGALASVTQKILPKTCVQTTQRKSVAFDCPPHTPLGVATP